MPRAKKRKKQDTPPPPTGGSEGAALQTFVTDFFTLLGAEKIPDEEALHVILSPELEALFSAGELKLAFHAHDLMEPDVHLIQPGSVLLEKMVAHLRERAGIALAEMPAAVEADAALPHEIVFRCEARLARAEAVHEEVVTFNFRISYVSDEKNEEIWTISLDSEGRIVEDGELLGRLAAAHPADGPLETSRRALGTFYAAAEERARIYAEQTATRYEQETLPRLYREIARLRAFYQAQIGELDPMVEQEAELRDHYERELRLRTEEEVANHRMSVTLALINFRMVRVPRARIAVRLQAPHSRRTCLFERDLSSGNLTRLSCESCGKPLEEIDLCAGTHLVCAECVRPCALCGRRECATCGAMTCAVCERVACHECIHRCAACENIVCAEHSGACPLCGRLVCQRCLHACAVCHREGCAAHLAACAACGQWACSTCREACADCGHVFCTAHTGTCERCGQVFCSEHLDRCGTCGAQCCRSHFGRCAACERGTCDRHRQTCAGCGSSICSDHAESCDACKAPVCAACGIQCAVTGRRLCPAHASICDWCGRSVGQEHAASCYACVRVVCDEHAVECPECGRIACPSHLGRCIGCEEALCGICASRHVTCSACSNPDSWDQCEAREVLGLSDMPDTWRLRVQGMDWWRARRRGRILYYGRRLFGVVIVVADEEGRFLRGTNPGLFHLSR